MKGTKKILALLLAMVMCLSLVACGAKTDETKASETAWHLNRLQKRRIRKQKPMKQLSRKLKSQMKPQYFR